MDRERVIVGIGEALLVQKGGAASAGGMAVEYAAAAAKLGCRGVCVSRIGQDQAGDDLLRLACERSVDVGHVQSDPDLPTGRMVVRSIAGKSSTSLTPRAAFDNLQWDFDLVDLAQSADAMFFGQRARRGGQTQSVIRQFLLECAVSGTTLRVFDLIDRIEGESVDRAEVWSALETCEVLIADEYSLLALVPFAQGNPLDAAREVVRTTTTQVTIIRSKAGERIRWRAISADDDAQHEAQTGDRSHEATIVRMVLALLDGQPLAAMLHSLEGDSN